MVYFTRAITFLPSLTVKSNACNLQFFLAEHDLAKNFDRVPLEDEETLVFKQQKEEDLQIYGDRSHPSDDVEVDEEDQLSRLPPKRERAEFQAALEGQKKKHYNYGYNHRDVTAMDWNAGESPLSAWLNQSAVPSTPPVTRSSKSVYQNPESLVQDQVREEREEVEHFKNIKIRSEEEAQERRTLPDAQQQIAALESGMRISCRDIEEKYPKLPHYM